MRLDAMQDKRRTDNTPVTDESLARVRTDQSAMLHRTIQNLTQREADLRAQLAEARAALAIVDGAE